MGLIKVLIYGNVWISISVASYLVGSFLLLNYQLDWYLIAFVFSSTLFTYNFQRLVKLKQSFDYMGERAQWLRNHRKVVLTLCVMGGIGVASSVWQLSFEAIVCFALLGMISILYATPFLKNQQALRDLPYIKIYLIALTWSLTAMIPILNQNAGIDYSDWLSILLEKMCFVLAITIPFDIRDLAIDDPEKKTIPQLIGIVPAKAVAIFLLTLHTTLCYHLYASEMLSYLLMVNAVTACVILFSHQNRHEMYYTGILDGAPIWTTILLCFAQ